MMNKKIDSIKKIKRYHCKQGYVIRKSKTKLMEIYERGRMDYINQRSHK